MSLSNYPPGVTGFEYAIAGATNEWEAEASCPRCGWEGVMHHETHPEFGIMAWCANPDDTAEVVYDSEESGRMTTLCPLTTEGFEIEAPEPEYEED